MKKQRYKILGWNYLIKDFKTIPKSHLVFLFIAGAFLITTSLFTFSNDFKEVTPFWKTKDLSLFQKVMQGISGITAFAGILNVYLVAKGKISNYVYGLITVTCYGLFAFSVAYTGDAILNIFFFIPFQFIGFYKWKKSMDKKDNVIPVNMNLKSSLVFLAIFIILFIIFWFLIPWADEGLHRFSDPSYKYPFDGDLNIWFKGQGYLAHAFDAMTNSFSITASVMMFMKIKFQWIVWLIINFLQATMYIGLNGWGINLPMIIMWGVFAVNAGYGVYMWYFKLKK